MKTLHHTETTWQGRKIIIDAADLTAEYGYIEVMAMYPDGREIECYHTHDPEDARLMFNHYCDMAADRPTADTYTRQDWISIHVLREEDDCGAFGDGAGAGVISIHVLREEDD